MVDERVILIDEGVTTFDEQTVYCTPYAITKGMTSVEGLKKQLSDKNISAKVRCEILVQLGSQFLQVDLEKARAYSEEAYMLAIENGFESERGLAINNFGVQELLRENAEAALEKFIEADYILQHSTSWEDRIIAKTNIGLVHTRTQQYDKCIEVYEQVVREIEQQPESIRHAQVYINLNAAYAYTRQREKALHYSQKALVISEKFNSDFGKAISHSNMGSDLLALEKLREAKTHLLQGIEISKQHSFTHNLAFALQKFIELLMAENDFVSAEKMFDETIAVCMQAGYQESLVNVLQHKMTVLEKLNRLPEALQAARDFIAEKENFINTEKAKGVNSLQVKYESEKKEAAIRQLQIDNLNSELKALKSQMNPHFIFNALNSIQEIFFLGDKRLANQHLSNFSQLTRKILHASGKTHITLQEDIDMLEQYLSLEALRFGDNFSHDIKVDDAIDPYLVELPPMLIQPYVENAVKHGLLHKETDRQLLIIISEIDNTSIRVTITDNGIGRAAAAEINENKKRIGQSFAGEATEKRLSLYGHNNTAHPLVTYTDLPQGTKVEIVIPIKP